MAQKVFLANSVWGGSEQKDRFLKEGIWENKSIDTFRRNWEQVDVNDILILGHTDIEGNDVMPITTHGFVEKVENEILKVKWVQPRRGYKLNIGQDSSYRGQLVLLERDQVDYLNKTLSEGTLKALLSDYLKVGGVYPVGNGKAKLKQKATHLKHALSIEENDQILVNKGYQNQGLIGFVYSNDIGEESIPLTQVFINSSEDYLYYLHRKNETFSDNDISEEKVIGYLSLSRNSGSNLELKRYKREEGSFLDHFYCTQPDEDQLRAFNYKREEKDFQYKYLLPEKGENLKPLYVYSTIPGVKLFKEVIGVRTSLKNDEIAQKVNPKKSKIRSKINGRKFFLAEYSSKDGDHTLEFTNSGFWEYRGSKPENFRPVIRNVRKGDVIILKSCYNSQGSSHIKIFAIGVAILDAAESSYSLNVEWEFLDLDLKYDENDLYQRTFLQLDNTHAEFFIIEISFLNRIILDRIIERSVKYQEKFKNPSKIPQNRNDQATGKDYLGIDKDVTAFAKIIASNSFNPPLAIALFGQWGSGKSFFMNKLQERIDQLSQTNSNLYSGGIVHIQFNAWSYIDANLWASIVSRIFEGLNQYINDESSVSKEHKEEVEKELNDRLKVLGDERKAYEKQKSEYQQKIDKLNNSKNELKDDIKAKIELIRTQNLGIFISEVDSKFNVLERLSEQELNKSDSKALKRIRDIVPEELLNDPKKAIYQVKSISTFLISFFRKDRLGWNLAALIFIIAICLGVPYLIELSDMFDLKQFQLIPQIVITSIGAIIPIWKRIESNYKSLQPAINSFWKIKQSYDKEKESAIASFNQNIEAIKIEIEQKKNEIGALDEQIISLETEINSLDFKLNNFLSTHSLYSFIEKRAKGDVYKKHLGIISTIRSDFEILSEMFDQSRMEQKNERFREYFKKPLERIILYIDDLDRCPEDRVIEVLEAVNLIMAFPLFVVVVGVDHRWVSNALIKQYHFQFKGSEEANSYQSIDASDYLEKIFQIPFHLNQPEEDSVRNMIKQLSKPKISKQVESEADRIAKRAILGIMQEEVGFELPIEDKLDQSSAEESSHQDKGELSDHEYNDDQLLSLSDKELSLIEDMANFIGSNPRAIKRFVNTYHIIRAHEGLKFKNDDTKDILILMFLLSLPMGTYKSVFRSLSSKLGTEGLFLRRYLNEVGDDNEEIKKLKSELVLSFPKIVQDTLFELDLTEFYEQYQFTKRFTFHHTA